MKKLILFAFLIVGMTMNAQNHNNAWSKKDKLNYFFISFSADAKHLVTGSKQTAHKKELDLKTKIGFIADNIETCLFYETFHRINYQAYGLNVGYIFQLNDEIDLKLFTIPLDKTDLYLGIEGSQIIRYSNLGTFSYGLNGAIRQHLNKYIIVFLNSNYIYRSDIHYKNTPMLFRFSGEVGIIFKLNIK